MNKNRSKALREGAMMVALTIAIVLATQYIPLFSLIGTFACGIPMSALASRNGFKVTIPAILAVALLSILVTGNIFSGISLMLLSVIPGAVAGYGLGKKYSFFKVLFACCIAVCIGWIFELLVAKLFLGEGIEELLSSAMAQMRGMMESMVVTMTENGLVGAEATPDKLIGEIMSATEQMTRLYLPSFIIISSMVSGYIIIRLCGFVINRAKLADIGIVTFSEIKAPASMGTAAILFYIVSMFADTSSIFGAVLTNIIFVLYTIIGVCGLSFLDFKLKAKIKSAALRTAIYILVFFLGSAFLPIISTVLIAIGIFDSTRNYRGLETNDN